MKKVLSFLVFTLAVVLLFASCRKEKVEGLSLGVEPAYQAVRLQPLCISCDLPGGQYTWRMVGFTQGDQHTQCDSLVSTQQDYLAILTEVGVYHYTLDYAKDDDKLRVEFNIHVEEELTVYSPYISDVLAYEPAPGQLVNRRPFMSPGITPREVLARCRRAICGNSSEVISLGGFGGSVTFAFDHLVLNRPGMKDFKILGNAFPAGSEPGIVMVAYDANGNGRPDEDEWYELRGSADSEKTLDYEVTYYYNGEEDPKNIDSINVARGISNPYYIYWEDNQGGRGYIPRLTRTQQAEYWPNTIGPEKNNITFRGSRLPNNGSEEVHKVSIEKNGVITYVYQVFTTLKQINGGYADDLPNELDPGLDIDDAMDKDGNPVHLPGIHFVKVYTAINQQVGDHGEVSTEIQGAVDLHMLKSKQ